MDNIVNKKIMIAVENSDLKNFAELLSNIKQSDYLPQTLKNCVTKAAIFNSLEIIKYILENPELEKKLTYPNAYNEAFMRACQYDNVEIIKYLSSSKNLYHHANVYEGHYIKFIYNIEVIKYLLTDSSLKPPINIEIHNHILIKNACLHGNLELVKFLLTSRNLSKHANIYCDDYSCFDCLCMYTGAEVGKNMEVLQWLLFDYNIELNPTIISILNDHTEAKKILEIYLLKNKIEQDLDTLCKKQDIVKI